MSEYVGEAFVKITPDTRGFAAEAQQQLSAQTSGAALGSKGVTSGATRSAITDAAAVVAATKSVGNEVHATQERVGHDSSLISSHFARVHVAGVTLRSGFALVGLAAIVGAQALHHLGEELEVTGAKADTLTGSLRNAASAALSGDFFTAAQRLGQAAALLGAPGRAAAKNQTDAEAALKARQDAITAVKTLLDLNDQLAQSEGQVGTTAGRANFQLQQQQRIAKSAVDALSPSLKRVGAAAQGLSVDANGNIVTNQALAGRNQAPVSDADRNSAFGLDAQRASQSKTLADDKRLFSDRETFLRGQIGYLEAAGAKSQAAKDRLATLYGQLDSVEGQLQTLEDDAAEKRRERLAARLALDQTTLQIQAANARTDAQENAAIAADAAFARTTAKNKNLDAQTRLGYTLQAAQDDKSVFENQKAAAEQAAADAREAAAKLKAAREETARKAKEEIDARRQAYRDDISLAEQKINLNVQRAQLTDKSLADDRKAIKAQIAFYQAQARDFKLTDSERLNFRSQAIAAQLSLKSLNNSNLAPRSSASDFFKEASSQFRSFGSNISTSGGILSGQDARGAFAARALGGNIAQTMAAQAQQTRNAALAEAQKQTGYLRTIANRITYSGATPDPKPKAIGKARRGAQIVGSGA